MIIAIMNGFWQVKVSAEQGPIALARKVSSIQMAIEMCNSYTGVISNACTWKQKEWNKDM